MLNENIISILFFEMNNNWPAIERMRIGLECFDLNTQIKKKIN
jgi:hypothetical protein